MTYQLGRSVSAHSQPSSGDFDHEFAHFVAQIERLGPDEAAEMRAWLSDELDRTFTPAPLWPEDLFPTPQEDFPSPSFQSSFSLPPVSSTTPAPEEYYCSPADTMYDVPTPRSDTTLLASPVAMVSTEEKNSEGGRVQLPDVPEESTPDQLSEYHWYGFQLHDHDASSVSSADPFMIHGRPIDVRDGEQQCGGLAAAPEDWFHSHPQDVGVSADPSAVASTSTTVPDPEVLALSSKAQKSRRRKAKKTSDISPKKEKKHVCLYEGCSYASDRSDNLKKHVNERHLGLRPFKCEAGGCNETFKRKYDLKGHYQSYHTDLPSLRSLRAKIEDAA
ncbi:hypothetical protein L226DRAFT_49212 [Lentinus tigrinus ALCF2SS1-7]|uniref:uncharacterized protein n=1 Tax=Lentinus tigrinus ALCF2SS1-7 TaxID=1328758 RepID=UPI0011661BE7|nr:hypothetical protein L226DRAFT_49212 [Lentinus tigrinus ALCF2SS1-7]